MPEICLDCNRPMHEEWLEVTTFGATERQFVAGNWRCFSCRINALETRNSVLATTNQKWQGIAHGLQQECLCDWEEVDPKCLFHRALFNYQEMTAGG